MHAPRIPTCLFAGIGVIGVIRVIGCLGCTPASPRPTTETTKSNVVGGPLSISAFRGARGCFLVREVGSTNPVKEHGVDCDERSVPASTFKIPNALIALDTNVIRDEAHVLPWDGKARWNAKWNRDHTLASAMRHSVVWYFQQIATQVGTERYKSYLAKLDYGNADPSGDVTMFWLNGTLRISPREQIRFLEKLYSNQLPVAARAMAEVKHTIELRGEAAAEVKDRFPFLDAIPEDVVFSGKTGTEPEAKHADGTTESIGWFVGSLERKGSRWVFACRIRSRDAKRGGAEAARIAYEMLRDEHLL
jgi:beta-lactamase class D